MREQFAAASTICSVNMMTSDCFRNCCVRTALCQVSLVSLLCLLVCTCGSTRVREFSLYLSGLELQCCWTYRCFRAYFLGGSIGAASGRTHMARGGSHSEGGDLIDISMGGGADSSDEDLDDDGGNSTAARKYANICCCSFFRSSESP